MLIVLTEQMIGVHAGLFVTPLSPIGLQVVVEVQRQSMYCSLCCTQGLTFGGELIFVQEDLCVSMLADSSVNESTHWSHSRGPSHHPAKCFWTLTLESSLLAQVIVVIVSRHTSTSSSVTKSEWYSNTVPTATDKYQSWFFSVPGTDVENKKLLYVLLWNCTAGYLQTNSMRNWRNDGKINKWQNMTKLVNEGYAL